MGLSQISAAVLNQGKPTSFEMFPIIGFQKTYSSDNLVTDSAASATAMACGKKTYNLAVGVDVDTIPCTSILEEAEGKGLATGIIVTCSIVHATPGAFYAHQPSRNFNEKIAADLVNSDIDFLVGGGKQYFDRRESDNRNLIVEMKVKGYQVDHYFEKEMTQAVTGDRNFFYLTADNQPVSAFQGRDYLPYATKKGLGFLKNRSEKGFFLMIEGSQIDWSCHANQGEPMLDEMVDFDQAVRLVLDFARQDGETLVVVTADHETGGLAINPGSAQKKLNLKFTTNGHTAAMVPVFAYGPGAELFRGIYENTAIHDKMRKALRFDKP